MEQKMKESGNKSVCQEFVVAANFSWPNFLPHANFSLSEKEKQQKQQIRKVRKVTN